MRHFGLACGACLLVAAQAAAAPPIQTWHQIAARRGPVAAARLRQALAAARPRGVDQAARVRLDAGTHYRALVILLQFSDHPADTLNHPPSAYDSLLFSVGTYPTGSLRDYYREVSRGAFDISGVVTRWYTAPRPYSDYTAGAGGFGGSPSNAQQMAADAVLLAEADYDLSQFDNDGPDGIPHSGDDDGQLDAVFVVHAGPGAEETADLNDIWSHAWNLPSPYSSPDGVVVYPYSTEPEEWSGSAPYTVGGTIESIGVFCHEFGHLLGLPDLYDTSNSPYANEGLGEWDLMASGLYNHVSGQLLATTPAHFSAWSLARLGWVQPTWVTKDSLGVTVPPVETSGQTFRVWTDGEENAEQFYVENRQPLGFDAGLVRSSIEGGKGPAHGLMIYHVDETVIGQSDADHKMIDVEEAGGVRIPSGFLGEQDLDVADGTTAYQVVCGGPVNVVGNRGDNYDPWPGEGARTEFGGGTCPNSNRSCGGGASQVAVRNIAEAGGNVTADFLVTSVTLLHGLPIVDDAPMPGTPNDGDGFVESGETVRFRIPITNPGPNPVGPLKALFDSRDIYLALVSDSSLYGVIQPGATDSGTVFSAVVTPAPDPSGAMLGMRVLSETNQVLADSLSILLGMHTGLCENFESGSPRWTSAALGCNGVDEWHREQGANSTGFGSWAWRMGPVGPIGSYAPNEDARLVSPPIRLTGTTDTLRFEHRYDSEFVFDGLTVEITTDAGATWSTIFPVGGYPTSDRYSGTRAVFTEAVFPLDGYSGIVQIGFRFRSVSPNDGIGWWLDDVTVTGDAPCAPVGIAIERFDAAVVPDAPQPRVKVTWALPEGVSGAVSIDRALAGLPPATILRLPSFLGEGEFDDIHVNAGYDYDYWLRVSRDGMPDAVAGPIRVSLPTPAPPESPRPFALAPVRPNPFRAGGAGLVVSLDRAGPFVVRIYRPDGALVRTMRFASRPGGSYPVTWDGRDDRGRAAAAGIYLFELRSDSRTSVQKAVMLR